MKRYLAILGRDHEARDAVAREIVALHPDWQDVAIDGCRLLAPASTPIATVRCGAGEAVVIGRALLRRDDTRLGGALSDADAATLVRAPETLLWGGWVAIARDALGPRATRDAVGASRAFLVCHRDLVLLFSHLEDACAAGLAMPPVDRAFVARYLRYARLRMRQTGLVGVDELLPGETLAIDDRVPRRSFVWTPDRFVGGRGEGDPASLRAIVSRVVRARTAHAARLLVHLSGGLDSAIVLAALVGGRPPSEIAALNLHADGDGDERTFARAAAAHVGCTLAEVPLVPAALDLAAAEAKAPLEPRPSLRLMSAHGSALKAAAQAAAGASHAVTGRGGDNLFLQTTLPHAPADRWFDDGALAALAHVRASAALTGRSLAATLSFAARYGSGRARWDPYRPFFATPTLLAPSWADDNPATLAHPWLANTQGWPPGKVQHVAAIIDTQSMVDLDDDGGVIDPLIAEPLVEHCLALPTYRLSDGALDRSLARAAFAPRLPRAILERRSKGEFASYYARVLASSAPALRAWLADSRLVDAGLVERKALAAALTPAALARGRLIGALAACIGAELWWRRLEAGAAASAPG